jgi:UDP-2-acetamido-2,6-beta-L-arabino-hexul-4-ose reductase
VRVLVTGSAGFIGRHLLEALGRREDTEVIGIDIDARPGELEDALSTCDAVFHLAGVNRPKDASEFAAGNAGLTEEITRRLRELGRAPLFVLSSSTQAELDNPYGQSKRQAEVVVERYAAEAGAPAVVFRLTNVFGKWARPNYNSAVATFCHNIARDLPVQISDPANVVNLVYIDDVVAAFLNTLEQPPAAGTCERREAGPWHTIALGPLVEMIRGFRASRDTLQVPDFSDPFTKKLYATYLSYLPEDGFAYGLDIKSDPRGSLAEFVKAPPFGQVFVSRTKPGITRGNHYHHTKTEKFLVVQGEGLIRFRRIDGTDVLEYRVRGEEYRVVDIPPGYTHSITNVGEDEMVTLFWSSEVFDPATPDTVFLEVDPR